MTTLVVRDVGVQVKIVKGFGEWYMVYVGSVLAIQVQKNEDGKGYYYQEFRCRRGCRLPLKDAMSDALKGLHLTPEVHKALMDDFVRNLKTLLVETA